MGVVNTFSPVAAEYRWLVINLHSLARDKGPINWKELLKNENRGSDRATATGTWLDKCSSTETTKCFPPYRLQYLMTGSNLGRWWRWMPCSISSKFTFELLSTTMRLWQRWGLHLSVHVDCWICLLSLVASSASKGSWWGKHLQRWMRSWPSRCRSLLSPYNCRWRMREYAAAQKVRKQ